MNVPMTRGSHDFKTGPYLHTSPNRAARRAEKRNYNGFLGNSKGNKITVSGKLKYLRIVQITRDGNRINHYLPLN